MSKYSFHLIFFTTPCIFADDCGDHVIVINSADIALPGDEWQKRVYFHHTGYPGGASWTLAWELHNKDPVLVRTVCSLSKNIIVLFSF